MPALSAGLLIFRIRDDHVVEVLIAHPGGPFWSKKDLAAWSIPKGEYEVGEDPMSVAEREFIEELGSPAPLGTKLDLGELKQPSGKRIQVWAIEGEFDASQTKSNTFEMEWPPKSGTMAEFPEVDRASWMTLSLARLKLVKGQVGFMDRLLNALEEAGQRGLSEGDSNEPGPQESLF